MFITPLNPFRDGILVIIENFEKNSWINITAPSPS